MGQLIVGLVVGVLLGAALSAVVLLRRGGESTARVAQARAEKIAAETRAIDLQGTIERERENHAQALSNLSDRFKVLASDTLESVVRQFHDGQVQVLEQREQKLDERLDPLQVLLREYKTKVEELETNREKGFVNVQNAATQLLEAQRLALDETRKLNTILGRSSARGRWGEVQLQRILEMAGMTKHVDFSTQLTVSGIDDSRQRPDVVVNLPNGAQIAIDAKVPFDAFDRAMATDDEVERETALKEYAGAMRSHIGDLKKKEYWSALKVAPEFVVCFVPSDSLLGAAFNADETLFDDALRAHVLVAGPTTLLGLLWTTWLGWSQFEAAENIEEITELATRLVDLTSTLFGHATKLGKSLDASTQNFNNLIGSLEGRLLVTVRAMQEKGVPNQKVISSVETLPRLTRPLDLSRWPQNEQEEPEAIDAQIVAPIELDARSDNF